MEMFSPCAPVPRREHFHAVDWSIDQKHPVKQPFSAEARNLPNRSNVKAVVYFLKTDIRVKFQLSTSATQMLYNQFIACP